MSFFIATTPVPLRDFLFRMSDPIRSDFAHGPGACASATTGRSTPTLPMTLDWSFVSLLGITLDGQTISNAPPGWYLQRAFQWV
jgi:hypothetical protein